MFKKEEILKEIKRTATENGGKVLGQTTFKNETGIRPWDWTKYWSTWKEAVIEAGLSPNERWGEHKEGVVEEDAIKLIRKLGKYFTKANLRVEKTSNSEFHYSAIDKKRKRYFLEKLIRYCEKYSSYEDILEICKKEIKGLKDKNEDGNNDSRRTAGEVYMCKYKNQRQPIKVGFTKDTVRRATEFGAEAHDELVMIHTIKTDDPSGVENYWKTRFKNEGKQVKNEWFKLTPGDIKAFKNWKKIY